MADKQLKFPPTWLILAAVSLIAILFFWMSPERMGVHSSYPISYTYFKKLISNGKVARIEMEGDIVRGELFEPMTLGDRGDLGQRFNTSIPLIENETLLNLFESAGIDVTVKSVREQSVAQVMLSWVPWVVIFVIWFWIMGRAYRNVGGGMDGRGDLKQFLDPSKEASVPKVKFSDVAGQEAAKAEVSELVSFLRNPDQFLRLGAEVPHGVLLMGPPGTGKTLLARALAGEAGVPFFSISASEFIEVFVGVGASRVRNLFTAAKQKAPSIIFIDELDSVGRTRGTGFGGGHDEREQTLNQILAEMDGFEGHEAVIVLAATNRPDVLDPALLRPGRFDRHVTLDLPDREDRKKILQVHLRNIPTAADVNLDQLAAGTPGFSGADLKNLVNEAAFFAARAKLAQVEMKFFDEARDKLLLGTVRTLAIQPDERHRLAVHEAGHTVAAFFMPNSDPVYKVTIIPRGRSLGGTHQMPEFERHTLPEDYLRNLLLISLAGRAAEKVFLGNTSSGADDDIRQATNIARSMVARWGMSEEVGPMDLRQSEENPFLGREMAQPRPFSEYSAQRVDEAIRNLLKDAEYGATQLLQSNSDIFGVLVRALEEKETLYKSDIEKILSASQAGKLNRRMA